MRGSYFRFFEVNCSRNYFMTPQRQNLKTSLFSRPALHIKLVSCRGILVSSVKLNIFRSRRLVFKYGEISLQGNTYLIIKGVHIVMHYFVKKRSKRAVGSLFLYFHCLSEDLVPNVYRGGSQSINNGGFDSSC